MRYEIDTRLLDDRIIVSETAMVRNGIRDNVVRTVIDTQDKQVREMLIKLGWTPPKEGL